MLSPALGHLDVPHAHLEDVLACVPRATLHAYGKGSLKSVLQWRSQRLGGRVVFHGFTPREELMRRLPEMDLALMPSLYEPFGYSALESLATDVPLVPSDAGGLGGLTAWLPEGMRLRTSSGLDPLFRSPGSLGQVTSRDELLRVFSFVGSHPRELEAAGRQGARFAREGYTAAHYARAMDTFLGEVSRSLPA